jgi:hypothetical protein
MKQNSEPKDESQDYKLRSLATTISPLITNIKEHTFAIKTIFENDILAKQALVKQLLKRIIEVANELEELRVQVGGGDGSILSRVASVMWTMNASIRGDATVIQLWYESGKIEEKKNDIERILRRIIRKSEELKEIHSQIIEYLNEG